MNAVENFKKKASSLSWPKRIMIGLLVIMATAVFLFFYLLMAPPKVGDIVPVADSCRKLGYKGDIGNLVDKPYGTDYYACDATQLELKEFYEDYAERESLRFRPTSTQSDSPDWYNLVTEERQTVRIKVYPSRFPARVDFDNDSPPPYSDRLEEGEVLLMITLRDFRELF